jgi:DNA helicase HerA-like ATPase
MGMLLIDLKDLRAMLRYVGDNAGQFTTQYGSISKQSIGAIQRALLTLEEQGGELFFGEPALDIRDFIRVDGNGKGFVNILASDRLFLSPALYSTFLLWLLSELYEELPEVGDLDKPKIVFFFDEAHLLFSEASKVLLQKIEQVIRLIRSKGVGVYFITQSPNDIPETVLGQLGNRVQHALRAFTPRDQNAVKAAAQTFRENPEFNVETVITELGVGEALISFLDEKGRPGIVERALVLPPQSKIGPIPAEKREELIKESLIYGKYEEIIDRVSAFECLKEAEEARQAAKIAEEERKNYEKQMKQMTGRNYNNPGNYSSYNNRRTTQRSRRTDTPLDRFAKSALSSIGRQVGNELVRGILGSLLRK